MNRSRLATASALFALLFAASLPAQPISPGLANPAQASPDKPLPSPPATADTTLGGKTLTVHYNAPSIRGRQIMGALVPYGKVWRTGANPATSFVTGADLTIGNLHVPAGKYTLYTLPAAAGSQWMLIVNKETGQWGTVYHEAQDLGRVPMHSAQLSTPQEVMSISFEKTTPNSTQLHVKWERTDQWVEIRLAR